MLTTEPRERHYTALLQERNGKFFIYQPEFGIIAVGESITAAHEKYLSLKRDFLTEIEHAGLQDLLPSPVTLTGGHSPAGSRRGTLSAELRLFIAKTSIVLAIMGLIGVTLVISTKRPIDRLIASATDIVRTAHSLEHISAIDIVNKIAQHAQAVPPARKEKLRQDIETLSREAAPLISSWQKPSPAPPK